MLDYLKGTYQFQSDLAYHKNPPTSWQQPAVDLLAGIDHIKTDVEKGSFANEYDFEHTLLQLLYSFKDAHVVFYAGALDVFTFGSPLRIVSASTDGIAFPKIYIAGMLRQMTIWMPLTCIDDLVESQQEEVDWEPSPVSSIDGQDPKEFLVAFAAKNSVGGLEPNADYQQLMSSPAGDIQSILTAFEGNSPFYPGTENITFAFENGTDTGPLPWLANVDISADTPLINDGDDFYQWFVLGNDTPSDLASATNSSSSNSTSSSSDDSSSDSSSDSTSTAASSDTATSASATPTPSGWDYFPYPSNPNVVQPDLGIDGGGKLTGYILADQVTAVLSIPSFSLSGEAILSFSPTVGEFIQKSKAAGCTRVVIDLQKNKGGGNLLPTDAFKQVISGDPENFKACKTYT